MQLALRCRVCDTTLPPPFLDLGDQPLANALLPEGQMSAVAYPLAVTQCSWCDLAQLTVTIPPDVLYAGYRFRSGQSPAWREYCDVLAKIAQRRYSHKVMLDIAANDGACMESFRRLGWNVLGVDPAPAPRVDKRTDAELPIVAGFWPDVVPEVQARLAAQNTHISIILAQNVLGHVNDPVGFLRGCANVMTRETRLWVEVPNAKSLYEQTAFDTIYHEHLNYWTRESLQNAARRAGLRILSFKERPEIHGGTLHVTLCLGDAIDFAQHTTRHLARISHALNALAPTAVIGAFGAPAKATVMLNALAARGHTRFPHVIIDETPSKQGHRIPGVNIPIVASAPLETWDACWIFPWNWKTPIKAKLRAAGFRGRFFLTTPTAHWEDA